MKIYDVTAERDGELWFIRIPEIDGATQALSQVEILTMARDYIATTLDISPDSFELTVNSSDG
ncbi:hypothetical protein [Streptomyces sp. AC495_CC817]|uniref:hypothetical protein n=1 Tax=Streptomyces sp. AC495_CC817 TaxID=2823900 RepID=UPI001C254601|nr:hypothetical protein [Streptomyces sp. AC495_CC817]